MRVPVLDEEAFVFDFAAGLALVALCALALPAGERLVAGFRRLDFLATARRWLDDVADLRDVERDASFFTLFVIGLLIRNVPSAQS